MSVGSVYVCASERRYGKWFDEPCYRDFNACRGNR